MSPVTSTTAPRDVVILGCTGSIGTQALDLVRRNPGRFRVVALAAGGGNPALLARQAIEFGVAVIAVASPAAVEQVRAEVADAGREAQARSGGKAPDLPQGLTCPDAGCGPAACPRELGP